ncbi:MAG: hypothetical protein ACLSG7_07030 [Clostridia bacterium]
MKANEVKSWARIGEVAFFLSQFFDAGWRAQYEPFESAGTTAQILALIWFGLILVFAEAIVRIIGYFAEILEERK